ncbi:hypothetical protein [Paraburkholderia terrae]|uniref:hypothetical protein n=1 Tax=Paraburkholderia terrae TaxID=311230 RepID=UPI001EE31EBF|nr:hypothetical protein [Paraburkholderia terrae]GJH02263.1 hypothetical protein CBA19C8_16920 [Paraburkholderia terrae]
MDNSVAVITSTQKATRKRVHTPRPPVDLKLDRRLTQADCAIALGIGKSTFRAGVVSGRYPAPDGRDGRIPYWLSRTIRRFIGLESCSTVEQGSIAINCNQSLAVVGEVSQ